MMIALPNPDRSFTCTLFWPNGGSGLLRRAEQPGGDRAALPRATIRTSCRSLRRSSTTTSTTPSVCSAPSTLRRGTPAGGSACSATPPTPSSRSTGRAPTARSRTSSSSTAASTRPADAWAVALPLFEQRRRDEHRGDRGDGPGELRRDARPGRVAGVPAGEAGRARSGTGAARRVPVARTSWCRSRRRRTPRCAGASACSTQRWRRRGRPRRRCWLPRLARIGTRKVRTR